MSNIRSSSTPRQRIHAITPIAPPIAPPYQTRPEPEKIAAEQVVLDLRRSSGSGSSRARRPRRRGAPRRRSHRPSRPACPARAAVARSTQRRRRGSRARSVTPKVLIEMPRTWISGFIAAVLVRASCAHFRAARTLRSATISAHGHCDSRPCERSRLRQRHRPAGADAADDVPARAASTWCSSACCSPPAPAPA